MKILFELTKSPKHFDPSESAKDSINLTEKIICFCKYTQTTHFQNHVTYVFIFDIFTSNSNLQILMKVFHKIQTQQISIR